MRIGILTYHFAHNFGAMIQAYALRMAVKELVGPEDIVDIINYRPASFRNPAEGNRDEKMVCLNQKRNDFLRVKCGIQEECVSDIKKIREYDYYIVGSDQVWNPNLPVYEETSEYFLDFVKDDKVRISYAASIGEDVYNGINTGLFEKNMAKFKCISIREQSHIEFIERFTDKKCIGVLDPTLLINKKLYEHMMPARKKEGKHILCATYNMKAKRRVYDLVNRYAIIKKRKVMHMDAEVSPYLFLNEEETLYYEGIEEILWAIKNAEMVITDSFHFLVFSIIFHKPFYVMPSAKNVRILDLLSYLKLEDRILRDDMKLSEINDNINYEVVDKLLTSKREISINFLKEALDIS